MEENTATTSRMGGEHVMITYDEVRKISASKARELVRKVLKKNGGNVSEAARILKVTRATVRRARDGDLEDGSRRPHRSPRKTESSFEELIVAEGKRTGFRYRRLTAYLERKYGIRFSEETVKAILRRNKVEKRKVRTGNGEKRPLYDYEDLIPFGEFQLDTKHLLDQKALPREVYEHMKRQGLPRYEWNLIEVATRARFTAYSHELSSTFGFMFIVVTLLWLRSHNVRGAIRIRLDNGQEFCNGSERKLKDFNEKLRGLDAKLDPIPTGAKHLLAVIENSHRADDEYFLMIHAERCKSREEFLLKAQRWQDTWNFFRPSFGIAMRGLTPYEKTRSAKILIHSHILLFPVFLMEDILKSVGLFTGFLKSGGQYVYTKCLIHSFHYPYSEIVK